MKTEDLCIFLTAYTLVVAFAAAAELLRRNDAFSVVNAFLALAAVSAVTVVGFYLDPGTSYPELLWFLVQQRDFSAVISALMGAAAAGAWVARLAEFPAATDGLARGRRRWMTQGLLAASICGVVLAGQAFIWKDLQGFQRDPPVWVHAPEFTIERVAHLEFMPIRIAAGESGAVYLNYDYHEHWGDVGGAIVRLSQDEVSGKFQQKIVADSPLLMRSYGLAFRDGSLFVSRTGIRPVAERGKIRYPSAGAITQLKDLDRDGYFEYAHDVVTGLPGVRGPDTMQQNNGIVFGADGSLWFTTASASNRTLDEHPWAGSVLRTSPDFRETEVVAQGFRNPFGIELGPEGEAFVTDNDVDENPGDELNHVVRGSHYGHPYVVPGEPSSASSGFREPILLGEHESNFLGMAYATSPQLPEPYRNCLYVADYMQHKILRLTLERAGESFRVSGVFDFATIRNPVDIAVTSSGELFVTSRRTQNVYRIRPKQP